MPSSLNEMDRELLGEIPHNNGAEAAVAKANGGAGHEASVDTGFTPLNATAVKVSSNGGDLDAGNVSQHSHTTSHITPTLDSPSFSSPSPHHFKPSVLCTGDEIVTMPLISLTYLAFLSSRDVATTLFAPAYYSLRFKLHEAYGLGERDSFSLAFSGGCEFAILSYSSHTFPLTSSRHIEVKSILFSQSMSLVPPLLKFLISLLPFYSRCPLADQPNGKKDTNTENTKATPKTPKKRGAAAAANDESSQPAKKRSPVKKATNVEGAAEPVTPSKKRASPKKKATDVNIKVENGETDGETEGPEPVTPKKGKRAPAMGKAAKSDSHVKTEEVTDKSVSPTKGNREIEGTTVHNTPRKRQAPKKELAAPRGIPSSWDEADQADRMMVTMKEKGKTWTEIRDAWKAATGQDTASRYVPLIKR